MNHDVICCDVLPLSGKANCYAVLHHMGHLAGFVNVARNGKPATTLVPASGLSKTDLQRIANGAGLRYVEPDRWTAVAA